MIAVHKIILELKVSNQAPNPSNSHVSIPNGTCVKITSVESSPTTPKLHQRNILCVRPFHVNLISVSQLTKDLNCSIQFFPNHCSQTTIGLRKKIDGLYYHVQQPKSQSQLSISYQVSIPSATIWHKRLGHSVKMPSEFLPKLFSFIFNSGDPCHVRPLAKQARLSCSISSIQNIELFDIIYTL